MARAPLRHYFSLGVVSSLAALGVLSTSAGAGPVAPSSAVQAHWWHPGPIKSWAYVIGETYPLRVPALAGGVQVYDADLGDQGGLSPSGAPRASAIITKSVRSVHDHGAKAICYIDAGTAENWRSDYALFPKSVLGRPMPGWPGERFIDVTRWSIRDGPATEPLGEIMTARTQLCREEGFDAVEADNVDAYTSGDLGGFHITLAEEEAYIRRLSAIAHAHGLAFFLKNGTDGDSLVRDVARQADGEVVEQCWQYKQCGALGIFFREHKPVLDVEYAPFTEDQLCPQALSLPMATIRTDLALNGKITYGCWQFRKT